MKRTRFLSEAWFLFYKTEILFYPVALFGVGFAISCLTV